MNKLTLRDVNLIEDVTTILGLSNPSIAEKDIFVTRAIHAVASAESEDFCLVFAASNCCH
ncbi:hypothetical protein BH10PSE19_BH10PSE19_21790 [soil metagenome]